MKIEPITDIECKPGRTKYTCGPVVFIEAEAGGVLADHVHPESETLWIISGKGKIQVGEKTHSFEGPCILKVPGNIYHKFMPITDVNFIEMRHKG
jgi:mannose-6-phosphate isomerase-like protein (cupin superfamily)